MKLKITIFILICAFLKIDGVSFHSSAIPENIEIVISTELDLPNHPRLAPDSWDISSQIIPPRQLYYININDSIIRQLIQTAEIANIGNSVQWSPDGHYISFIAPSPLTDNGIGEDIYIRDMINQDLPVERITLTGARSFRWSNDSQLISFINPRIGLSAVNVNSGDTEVIFEGNPLSSLWSPDGNSIAIIEGIENPILYVITVQDETFSPAIPYGNVRGFPLAWHPTQPILAMVERNRNQADFYTLNLETGESSPITENNTIHTFFGWTADGDSIIYRVGFDRLIIENTITGYVHEVTRDMDLIRGLPEVTPTDLVNFYEVGIDITIESFSPPVLVLNRRNGHRTIGAYSDYIIVLMDEKCWSEYCTEQDLTPILQAPGNFPDLSVRPQ